MHRAAAASQPQISNQLGNMTGPALSSTLIAIQALPMARKSWTATHPAYVAMLPMAKIGFTQAVR
jgi:hypothetical protein